MARTLWRRFVAGFRTKRSKEQENQDLIDELDHFYAEAEQDLMYDGLTQEEARREVRMKMGNRGTAREMAMRYGWENRIADVFSDLRQAVRRLRRTPGFCLAAIGTIGIAIGASTAIYSIVNPVLFRPFGYPGEERVITIAGVANDGTAIPVAFGTFREVVERATTMEALSVYTTWEPGFTLGAETRKIEGQRVSADFFQVLGVAPMLGRGFQPDEDVPDGADVAVLSYRFWRDRLGGDPESLGATVTLDSRPFTIIGVMPAGFQDATNREAEFWVPLQYDRSASSFNSREWGLHLGFVGRIGVGQDLEVAAQRLNEIASSMIPEFARPEWASLSRGFVVRPVRELTSGPVRPVMLVLMTAAGVLLITAAMNVAILLLARGWRRRQELSMRLALGAGWGRLVRQLLAESLVLAGLGGLLGVGLANLNLAALVGLIPSSFAGLGTIAVDRSALAFAVGLAVIVGIVVGTAPILMYFRSNLFQHARQAGKEGAGRVWSQSRVLVAGEVALAVVLLVGAGLVTRSTDRLFAVSSGFDSDNRVVMQVSANGLRGGDQVVHEYFDEVRRAALSVPGVEAVALTTLLPLSGGADNYGISVDGSEGAGAIDSAPYRYAVSGDYFETVGMTVLEGRGFASTDGAESQRVAVVSQSLASRLWGDRDPIGGRVRIGPQGLEPFTVVGVVNDVKQESLELEDADAVYIPAEQWHWSDRVRWVVASVPSGRAGTLSQVRAAIQELDGNQAIAQTGLYSALVRASEAQRRSVMVVLAFFATCAILLSGVGLYAVTSGGVSERMPEIAVRSALGASTKDLIGLVVGQGMMWVGLGVIGGVVAALAGSQVLTSVLYGVSRADPGTYLVVSAVVALVALSACWIPAVRAARVDVLENLQAD